MPKYYIQLLPKVVLFVNKPGIKLIGVNLISFTKKILIKAYIILKYQGCYS